jgi:hypothetical protein
MEERFLYPTEFHGALITEDPLVIYSGKIRVGKTREAI